MKASNLERRDSALQEPRLFRSAYGGKRVRVQTAIVGESRTKQSFAAECDVNTIMRRYAATGILPGADRVAGARYLDCTGADFHSAMLLVASARSAFADMPARIRDRFQNDPKRLMEFLEDERNLEEARELGLVNPAQQEATPLAVRVVEPAGSVPSETSGTSDVPGVIAKPGKPA